MDQGTEDTLERSAGRRRRLSLIPTAGTLTRSLATSCSLGTSHNTPFAATTSQYRPLCAVCRQLRRPPPLSFRRPGLGPPCCAPGLAPSRLQPLAGWRLWPAAAFGRPLVFVKARRGPRWPPTDSQDKRRAVSDSVTAKSTSIPLARAPADSRQSAKEPCKDACHQIRAAIRPYGTTASTGAQHIRPRHPRLTHPAPIGQQLPSEKKGGSECAVLAAGCDAKGGSGTSWLLAWNLPTKPSSSDTSRTICSSMLHSSFGHAPIPVYACS